uniref:small monomeric GTPase n=1 Tax=Astatotilapia calliptera TaxID=8154 RepID=A0AAX7SU68_ASTCA
MERMESMEPISAYYTTDYPEIQPDSTYGSKETTESQAMTPPPPTYDEELVHKTILVGDSGVGKTSLLVQFDQGKFIPGSFSATVGIGFTNKVVTVDNVKVKLQIWDTAGQERFRSVTHAYYRDAHGEAIQTLIHITASQVLHWHSIFVGSLSKALLLLYDITSKSSFDNIRAWLTEIHEYAQSNVVIMLLGNKADMSSDRAIRRDEGERLAREYSVPFMETSAKTGVNVDLAFTAVAKELKHRAIQHPSEPKFQIHEYIEAQKEKSGCCSYF